MSSVLEAAEGPAAIELRERGYRVRRTGLNPVSAPVASIIVPALNEEKLIGDFLSIFSRDLLHRLGLEVIVSDGGSSDATAEIAGSYADYIVEYGGEDRQTIAEGRNAGARIARGEVLIFLNADVTLPDPVEAFLDQLSRAASEFGAATCNVTVSPGEATWKDHAVMGVCNFCYATMNRLRLGAGRGECHAVYRPAFEAVGGYDENLVAGEDFELFGRLARFFRKRGEGRIKHLTNWSVYEDPRRYRQYGYARTLTRWVLNYFAVTFLKKSHSRSWDPVR